MGLPIKNGEIVTAADRFVADVYCDGGRVVAIGEGLEREGTSVGLEDELRGGGPQR